METKVSFFENGLVAQLVRALACHARGRGFEPHPSRHPRRLCSSVGRAGYWKSPCRWFDSDRRHHICGFSSFGRAPPCQGGGGGFEPRNPLQKILQKDTFCSIFLSKPQVWYRRSQARYSVASLLTSPREVRCISSRARCALVSHHALACIFTAAWWYTATSCGWHTRLCLDLFAKVWYNKLTDK